MEELINAIIAKLILKEENKGSALAKNKKILSLEQQIIKLV